MMNTKKSLSRRFGLAGLAVWVLVSCSSIPAVPSGTVPDPQGQLTVALQTDTQGKTRFQLTGPPLEGATLTGPAARTDTGWTLTATGLDWFNNWTDGWTRARFTLDGELELTPGPGSPAVPRTWRLTVRRPPVIDVPDQAKVRFYDQYFWGDRALTLFTDRWNRIEAAAAELNKHFGALWFARTLPTFSWGPKPPNFQETVGPWLFPEVYGYPTPPVPGHAVHWAGDIPWDTGYSAAVFPETLRPVRDSGTLFQDFEETPGLWRLAYVWNGFWAIQAPAAHLTVKGIPHE
jgi:hypothetical protein